jgi:hypothetical protein
MTETETRHLQIVQLIQGSEERTKQLILDLAFEDRYRRRLQEESSKLPSPPALSQIAATSAAKMSNHEIEQAAHPDEHGGNEEPPDDPWAQRDVEYGNDFLKARGVPELVRSVLVAHKRPMKGAEITTVLKRMGVKTEARKGLNANVLSALTRKPDWFEKVPGQRGVYRLRPSANGHAG